MSIEEVHGNYKRPTTMRDIVARAWLAAAAACVARSITAPLDRIRVYLQVSKMKNESVRHLAAELHREGGIQNFWRGNGVTVIKTVPETLIKFITSNYVKQHLQDPSTGELSLKHRFLSSAIAGATSQTIIYPFEVMKSRLCLSRPGQYKGIYHLACTIYINEGIAGFYKGFAPGIIYSILHTGIDLTFYQLLKQKVLPHHRQDSTALTICGTASTMLGQIASYPFQLFRTGLQTSERGITRKRSIRQTFHREGILGFYRGLTITTVRIAPCIGLSYAVYDTCHRMVGVPIRTVQRN